MIEARAFAVAVKEVVPPSMWADIVKRFNELLDRDPSDLLTADPEDAAQRAEDGRLDEH